MSRMLLRLSGLAGSQIIPKRFAGHSKWQNIRHIKAAKDLQKSDMFRKFGRQLRLAVIDGGSADPTKNSKLKSVIDIAKRNSMPLDTVTRIIKSTVAQDQGSKSSILELKGPGGSILLVTIVSNNINATKNVLKSTYRKYLFQESPGIIKSTFEHKGVVTAKPVEGAGSLESSMEHAIEAGAEDVLQNEDGTFEFLTESGDVFLVQAQLSKMKYEILEATSRYQPTSRVSLPDDALELISILCDKLLSEPDVVEIVDNIE